MLSTNTQKAQKLDLVFDDIEITKLEQVNGQIQLSAKISINELSHLIRRIRIQDYDNKFIYPLGVDNLKVTMQPGQSLLSLAQGLASRRDDSPSC